MSAVMETPSRETAHESGGYVKGVAIAVVTQNNDDEQMCRVKVRFPWHEDSSESYWARLATPMAGDDRGLVLIPEVGDEVLVAFEREDLRFPYVLGGLWNGQDKPPIANDDGNNDKRILQSRKKHYLLFNDGSTGVVELKHEKGRKITLDDNGFVVEDGNGNSVKVDSNSGAMTLEATGQLTIRAATISIDATGSLELKASGTVTIRGSLVSINYEDQMGQPAARVGDVTSHGTPLVPGPGSPTVLIGGLPAWRATADTHLCPLIDGLKPHVGGVVAVGSLTVLIGGLPAARQGDFVVEAGAPNAIAMGAPTVLIG